MCNRYRPVSVTVVRDVFGFTLLEQPQPLYATQFETLSVVRPGSDIAYALAYSDDAGSPFGRFDALSFEAPVSAPEPSSVCLIALGVFGMVVRRPGRKGGAPQ